MTSSRKPNPSTATQRTDSSLSAGAVLAILTLSLLVSSGAVLSAGTSGLNNVQVFIQTSNAADYQYQVTVYNTTGTLVAYGQSNYAATGFELPSGTYLITANAYTSPNYRCYNICYVTASSPPQKSSAVPQYEYGYVVEQVSGPDTVTIATQNDSQVSAVTLTIRAVFANGTSVSGASVSSFVVGGSYYYSQRFTMYGQTDSSGAVKLTVPSAPVEVNVYSSVPVNLPKNQTTVTRIIGGQKVNVTVYWSPMYIEMTGSALILPPTSSASITLQYQQNQYYCCYAAGPLASSGGSSTMTYTMNGAPAQDKTQSTQTSGPATMISPFGSSGLPSQNNNQAGSQALTSIPPGSPFLMGGVAIALALTLGTVTALLLRGRRQLKV